MFWELLWALILGLALSAVVQAVVSKREMQRLLPDDSPRSLAAATNGDISFGGVLAFIFADLIVLPILDIYRRYYGWRVAGFLLASFK